MKWQSNCTSYFFNLLIMYKDFTSYFYTNKLTLRNWLLFILCGCVYMFPSQASERLWSCAKWICAHVGDTNFILWNVEDNLGTCWGMRRWGLRICRCQSEYHVVKECGMIKYRVFVKEWYNLRNPMKTT
jgi:hypothetical protein